MDVPLKSSASIPLYRRSGLCVTIITPPLYVPIEALKAIGADLNLHYPSRYNSSAHNSYNHNENGSFSPRMNITDTLAEFYNFYVWSCSDSLQQTCLSSSSPKPSSPWCVSQATKNNTCARPPNIVAAFTPDVSAVTSSDTTAGIDGTSDRGNFSSITMSIPDIVALLKEGYDVLVLCHLPRLMESVYDYRNYELVTVTQMSGTQEPNVRAQCTSSSKQSSEHSKDNSECHYDTHNYLVSHSLNIVWGYNDSFICEDSVTKASALISTKKNLSDSERTGIVHEQSYNEESAEETNVGNHDYNLSNYPISSEVLAFSMINNKSQQLILLSKYNDIAMRLSMSVPNVVYVPSSTDNPCSNSCWSSNSSSSGSYGSFSAYSSGSLNNDWSGIASSSLKPCVSAITSIIYNRISLNTNDGSDIDKSLHTNSFPGSTTTQCQPLKYVGNVIFLMPIGLPGAGKTTVLKNMMHMLKASKGSFVSHCGGDRSCVDQSTKDTDGEDIGRELTMWYTNSDVNGDDDMCEKGSSAGILRFDAIHYVNSDAFTKHVINVRYSNDTAGESTTTTTTSNPANCISGEKTQSAAPFFVTSAASSRANTDVNNVSQEDFKACARKGGSMLKMSISSFILEDVFQHMQKVISSSNPCRQLLRIMIIVDKNHPPDGIASGTSFAQTLIDNLNQELASTINTVSATSTAKNSQCFGNTNFSNCTYRPQLLCTTVGIIFPVPHNIPTRNHRLSPYPDIRRPFPPQFPHTDLEGRYRRGGRHHSRGITRRFEKDINGDPNRGANIDICAYRENNWCSAMNKNCRPLARNFPSTLLSSIHSSSSLTTWPFPWALDDTIECLRRSINRRNHESLSNPIRALNICFSFLLLYANVCLDSDYLRTRYSLTYAIYIPTITASATTANTSGTITSVPRETQISVSSSANYALNESVRNVLRLIKPFDCNTSCIRSYEKIIELLNSQISTDTPTTSINDNHISSLSKNVSYSMSMLDKVYSLAESSIGKLQNTS